MDVIDVIQKAPSVQWMHLAGAIAMVIGVISTIGLGLLIAMFASLSAPVKVMGYTVGTLNDICVTVQYLLTIPIALVLYRILLVHNSAVIRAATLIGIASMMIVVVLQLLLISKMLTFEQQGVWVTLAMILGVGFWLVMTGLVAKATGRMPNSLLYSALAVPYIGYPVWAFWLGLHLLNW